MSETEQLIEALTLTSFRRGQRNSSPIGLLEGYYGAALLAHIEAKDKRIAELEAQLFAASADDKVYRETMARQDAEIARLRERPILAIHQLTMAREIVKQLDRSGSLLDLATSAVAVLVREIAAIDAARGP